MYFRAKKKHSKEVSLYEPIGTDKEGNEIDVQKPISYHTTLESALHSYSNNRMADLVSNVDLDLKQVKEAINELKEELKVYETN